MCWPLYVILGRLICPTTVIFITENLIGYSDCFYNTCKHSHTNTSLFFQYYICVENDTSFNIFKYFRFCTVNQTTYVSVFITLNHTMHQRRSTIPDG